MSQDAPTMFELRIAGHLRTVLVDFGVPLEQPRSPCIRLGDAYIPILSCRDWWGDELRDELTADHLLAIGKQLRGVA